MFIGHLPTGYIYSKFLLNNIKSHVVDHKKFLGFGILGAIFPDIDMLYFYLVDDRQHHHHMYFTHYPIVWFVILLLSIFRYVRGKSQCALLFIVFSSNALIHMVLDTLVGDIWWFAPFIDKPFAFFTVPTVYHPWWLNFLLHWSFLIEMALCFYAIVFWYRQKTKVYQL